MTSFSSQLDASKKAHVAVKAIEAVVRGQVSDAFTLWEEGALTDASVRWKLERIVRSAYRSSASVGLSHMASQSEIPDWKPSQVFQSDYLKGLLADVRRNLREYKASARDDKARRRALARIRHSAGVAATRGFTDGVMSASTELSDFGTPTKKLWLANFVNNMPCDWCRELHGTEVPLGRSFPSGHDRLKVYGDLLGPPRHPQCQCRVVVLLSRLENVFDSLDLALEGASPPSSMTTDDVKTIPKGFFGHLVSFFKRVISFLSQD